VESGSIEDVKRLLMKVSPDTRVQGLLIAFAFGGFLESVTGFGTSVAIPAGILISMGYKPLHDIHKQSPENDMNDGKKGEKESLK